MLMPTRFMTIVKIDKSLIISMLKSCLVDNDALLKLRNVAYSFAANLPIAVVSYYYDSCANPTIQIELHLSANTNNRITTLRNIKLDYTNLSVVKRSSIVVQYQSHHPVKEHQILHYWASLRHSDYEGAKDLYEKVLNTNPNKYTDKAMRFINNRLANPATDI